MCHLFMKPSANNQFCIYFKKEDQFDELFEKQANKQTQISRTSVIIFTEFEGF